MDAQKDLEILNLDDFEMPDVDLTDLPEIDLTGLEDDRAMVNAVLTATGAAPLPSVPATGEARTTGTQSVTIRLPRTVLAACKRQAAHKGTQYQTLIVRTLKTACKGW